jgi:hypothetical protein
VVREARRVTLKKKLLQKDVYGSSITLLYGTRQECIAFLRKAMGEKDYSIGISSRAHTTEWRPSNGSQVHYVSLVKEHCSNRFDRLAALGHELLHVVLAILEYRGVKITSDNDEPVTYYFEWLFRICAKEVWR